MYNLSQFMRMKSGLQKTLFLFVAALLLVSNAAVAQSLAITGTVTSPDKQPIIGATVLVDGTTTGTVTDFMGNFQLAVPAGNGSLSVSYLGYQTQKIAVTPQKNKYAVVLAEETQKISDIVVVGYGTMRKKEVTGAVARVTADEITKVNTSDLGTALQGLIAGVSVQASSGEPGASSNIQIRGVNSISGSNSPLYVVDGVPYDGDPGLSSNEIASIDILKDAASSAIYGTRGAGGVILITTKQGEAGRMKVRFDASYGVQKITSGVNLMDADEYIFVKIISNRTNADDSMANDTNASTSLQSFPTNFFNNNELYSVVTNNYAPVQNYSLNVSGGNKGLTYNFVANYFSQDGVIINSAFDRYNVRSNVNYKHNKFTFNSSVGFRIEESDAPGWGLLASSYTYSPVSSAIDPDSSTSSSAGTDTELTNMGAIMQKIKQTNNSKTENLTGNFYVAYDIIEGLNISSRLGVGYTNLTKLSISPQFEIYNDKGQLMSNSSYRSKIENWSSRNTSLTWENMLNYKKSWKSHNLTATAVFGVERYTYGSFFASIQDLMTNDIPTLNAGTADKNVGIGNPGQYSQDRVSALVGMMARVQYNYKSRYMFSGSIRRDGSSRFSEDNRWGMFPSASVGWNISEEPFYKDFDAVSNIITSLKLRGSLGTTGNQNFTDYYYAGAIYDDADYTFGQGTSTNLGLGYAQQDFYNPEVVWETTQQINLGLDFGFAKNKLTFSADVYKSTKNDMLFPLIVPASNGDGSDSTVTLNAGNMENKGYELMLNYRNKLNKMNYSAGFTLSQNENKITKMAGSSDMYYFPTGRPVNTGSTSDYVTTIKTGYEAGAFFVYKTNGIINTEQKLAEYQKYRENAEMGDLIYVDTNNDGVIDESDKVYGGSGMPKVELGLNLAADYKGFDLSMNWFCSLGNEIIDGTKIYTYQESTNHDLIYAWSETNFNTSVPRVGGTRTHDNYAGDTDIWIENGSFLRLKNLTLGYTLPKQTLNKMKLSKVRVYVAADNLLTFTKYNGYDPEVGNDGLARRGLDFSTYPISIQLRGGCQIQF